MVDAIAQAMTCLAQDADRADRMSRKARVIAEARFTRDGVSHSWIDAAYGADVLAAARSSERSIRTTETLGAS